MTTTLTAARKSLLALVNTLPPNSTYADHAAVVADYLDNQVPLNIENKTLREQLAARSPSEGFGLVGKRFHYVAGGDLSCPELLINFAPGWLEK